MKQWKYSVTLWTQYGNIHQNNVPFENLKDAIEILLKHGQSWIAKSDIKSCFISMQIIEK